MDATGSPALVREVLASLKLETEIDWQRTFPNMLLGPHRDPRELARAIERDVAKLKSLSDAGRAVIREERCAQAGITIDGTPCFYIDRTRIS